MIRKSLLLAIALNMSLSGCALHPLYSGGSKGSVARFQESVSVSGIDGKMGWLMHNALVDRIGTPSAGAARYRLDVELDDKITGSGSTRNSNVTREIRTVRARYHLVDNQSAEVVLDATAGSDESLDVVSSEYATIAGENSALERLTQTVADQIVARIALFAARQHMGK